MIPADLYSKSKAGPAVLESIVGFAANIHSLFWTSFFWSNDAERCFRLTPHVFH